MKAKAIIAYLIGLFNTQALRYSMDKRAYKRRSSHAEYYLVQATGTRAIHSVNRFSAFTDICDTHGRVLVCAVFLKPRACR